MADTFDVILPDGTPLKGIPVGTTKEQVAAKAKANGYNFNAPLAQSPGIMDTAKFGLESIGKMWPESVTPTDIALIPAAIGGEGLAYKGAEALTGAATRALPRLAQSIAETPKLSGAVNIGKAAGAGAAGWGSAGAAGGAIDAPPGKRTEGAIEGAKEGAKTGVEYGIGGAALGKTFEKAGEIFKGKPPIPESGEIKLDSQNAYNWFEKQGGGFTPKFTDKFLSEVDKMVPQTAEGKIFAGNNEISALVARAQKLRGEGGYADPYGVASKKSSTPISFKGMEEIDKELTNQVSKHFGPNGLDEQGKAIADFQDKFRGMIDKASGDEVSGNKEALNAYKYARDKWSQAARMRDVEQIISRAQMMDNPATAMKTGFRTLYNSKRISPYTDEEKAAIKLAAEGKYTDILRTFGSRLIPIAASAKGAGLFGDAGAYAASAANRKAAELLQLKRAQDVRKSIAGRNIPRPAGMDANQALGAETDPLSAGKNP